MKTAVASVVVILALALPGVASAGTASLVLSSVDPGGTTFENLSYRAGSGETNRLTVSFDRVRTYTLTDSAGITPGPGCSYPNPSDTTRVQCVHTTATELLGVQVSLGDRNDSASLRGQGGTVLGGSGSDVLKGSQYRDTLSAGSATSTPARARTSDRLSGGSGDDTLVGSAGRNRITGGQGHDGISAGRGADRINARDGGRADQVTCGGGTDVAKLDTADFTTDRCEHSSRPRTPAATPLDLFTSDPSAFVEVGCPGDSVLTRCVGTVKLSRGSRSFGTKRFSIRRGHKTTKGFRLPKSIRNQIGVNGGPRVKVTVRSKSRQNLTSTLTLRRRLPPPGD